MADAPLPMAEAPLPTPTEVGVKLPRVEAIPKAPQKKDVPAPLAGTEGASSPTTSTTAREQLEAIAKGPPPSEPAKEVQANREKIDQILSTGNEILLQTGDKRLMVTTLARNAKDSALGNEVRRDSVTILKDLSTQGLPTELAAKADAMKKAIDDLNLPEPDKSTSAFAKLLEGYNEAHPTEKIAGEVIAEVKSGKTDASKLLIESMQSNPDLSTSLRNELFDEAHPMPSIQSPESLLTAAGIQQSRQNMEKATAFLAPLRAKKPDVDIMEMIPPTLMGTALVIMFLTQLTSGEGGGGH